MPTASAKAITSDTLARKEILAALRALRRGDFAVRMPDDRAGLDGQICEVFNEVAELAATMSSELKYVQQGVGGEGRLRRRMRRHGMRGGWADCVSSVNELIDDLTSHTDDIVRVVGAVAKGDLGQTMDLDGQDAPLRGDFLKHARLVNGMVVRLSELGSEVTRVAQEVGIEGRLGAQAKVAGASGAWRDLTEAVNSMAANLTSQVREIARVTTAVAQGDLGKTINIEVRGEILELKNTINTMVGQLGSFADEVTRVAREVGNEGILGGQARVHGVSGVWRELTENVNSMANNLTLQVRNIAEVATAIADGDLSKKITVPVKGEISELKNTINTMVDQLSSFASEVTRVARDVGTDGVLGVQAEVSGVSGVWRELTENVNSMANNLTSQVRSIAEVVTAIAQGDLSRKIMVDARGEILALKNTINTTVDKLNSFSAEVTRVARLVGTEGTLGVQAEVRDVSGIWKELTDNVNFMADNLTNQVRNIAEVTTAVANGDLSKKITVEVRGEILALKNTINAMVDRLGSFADEVTRMAREVGTDGVLGGQAVVRDVSGIWKELTDNVNSMASNLTSQVRNIAEVASAVASGDLSKKITVDVRGEVEDLKNTLNAMVDQLNAFGAEVTRVAREVGVEGRLGGQASVEGVRGIWKELTGNVNLMASNLTNQVRDIAEVTTAVANGDLTRKIVVDARGEILEVKNTINTMVDQLGSFAAEVTRLASDVGIEGVLGGQADVRGVSGTWRDLTDAVNSMAANLTNQVRNISQVASAIARGDLDKKIVVDARGEILELKNTINTMVDQLGAFAEQVTQVAREVGTEGKLGGQASVEGVRGIWKELTGNVNQMASNLTAQVRDIAQVATAIAGGDLGRKVTVEVRGEISDLKNTINIMVDQLSSFADEVTRVARDVGVEGKLGGQADVHGVSGIWKELTDNVNLMASNLTSQVRDIADVTTAVAKGDLSRKITVEVRGEILELKNTINTMVDQLSSFADEVTRVAREVGIEGILGGEAEVRDVSGIWKELTDNVNVMARNLTQQVRGIARVVTAVANGDLEQKLTLDARGEIATLVDTINNMLVTLSTFAEQVSGVARDVGFEGRLGGQADVPGAAGVWRDLTSNVNELASNLTRQVRAIGDVATSVTEGDLTRTIDVEARGEVALLKDNINQMIGTLAETTRVNEEQDWLKTNLARFTRMLQGQRDLLTVAQQVLSELAPVVGAQHGAFYVADEDDGDGELRLRLFASYAFSERKTLAAEFRLGQGLVGQAALERKRIVIERAPPDYVRIGSALGEALPSSIVVAPIVFEAEVKGVIELASFQAFSSVQLAFLDQLLESLGIVVATIEATMRTDELLRESQSLAEELQTQQEELQQTNEELEEKARQLTIQKVEVERRKREIEAAKRELEDKAEQLALTSRYKSEFLANMSHELRTPLNSLLILSRQLGENSAGNLDEKQMQFAQTIHQAGSDLLGLIDEILDLAKIESGTMVITPSELSLAEFAQDLERSFEQVAAERSLSFDVEVSQALPGTIETDEMRLKQILRNLLSNAFKFTETGGVSMRVDPIDDTVKLAQLGPDAVAISVRDTGIGIAPEHQRMVFEAFQQADGGTARRYGGTGLGLSISREIAGLLGGWVELESGLGEGSTFTLCLPRRPTSKNVPASPVAAGTDRSHHHGRLRSLLPTTVSDDRSSVRPGDTVFLLVEGDSRFARVLLEETRRLECRGVVATNGAEALRLAEIFRPTAIVLDLELPDMSGWVVVDRLKRNLESRHIPVQLLCDEREQCLGRSRGAIGCLPRSSSQEDLSATLRGLTQWAVDRTRRLLFVGPRERRGTVADLVGSDVVTTWVDDSVMEALGRESFDCLLVDPTVLGTSASETIRRVRRTFASLPIIVCIAEHDRPEPELYDLVDRVVLDGAHERLLEALSLFLHQAAKDLLPEKRDLLREGLRLDPILEGRCVLVVDDDMRNVFALTTLLETQQMEVCFAENGREAIMRLDANPEIDLVLMDIMMPEMDGYEAIRAIRRDPARAQLPIIALTAKAMPEDRDRCIESGASDYITKPVDSERLLSLMRVWLADAVELRGRRPRQASPAALQGSPA
jgi:HAMP domain-containing protein/signal transduction histidine kinase/CheY-like chemotaxis protein